MIFIGWNVSLDQPVAKLKAIFCIYGASVKGQGKNLYEDENIKADCKTTEEYIDGYDQSNESFFTKIIHEFHVSLGCCSTCGTIEITLLEIIHKDSMWQNLGRRFFVLRTKKSGHYINIIYYFDTIYGRIFYKDPSWKDAVTSMKYQAPMVYYNFIHWPPSQ